MNTFQLACATCGTDPTEAVTQAANGAIIFMLFVLIPVLGGFLAFIRHLAKSEKRALEADAQV